MIYLGNSPVGVGIKCPLPSFFNHFKSGSFIVSGSDTEITIDVGEISDPKGILVFSNTPFDTTTEVKADKSFLGAYAAIYLRGIESPSSVGNTINISEGAFYLINWGGGSTERYATPRHSRTENRGLRNYYADTKTFKINGFGTGDYDFKRDIKYNWIVWD